MDAKKKLSRGSSNGFTLLELLVVIAIIAILAALMTTSALRARVNANESSAQGSLKAILSAVTSYRATNGQYPADLTTLGTAYIGGFETGTKSGYAFVLASGNNGQTFTATAVPDDAVYTGNNSYCMDTLSVIYRYDGAPDLTSDGTVCPAGGNALM